MAKQFHFIISFVLGLLFHWLNFFSCCFSTLLHVHHITSNNYLHSHSFLFSSFFFICIIRVFFFTPLIFFCFSSSINTFVDVSSILNVFMFHQQIYCPTQFSCHQHMCLHSLKLIITLYQTLFTTNKTLCCCCCSNVFI